METVLSRLGRCEVCDKNKAKYTCPECEVKTCCLTCVKIHKKELNCSGIRNKVKYKPLKKFNDLDLQSDYMLLEDTGRMVEFVCKRSRLFQREKKLTCPNIKLIAAASKRGVRLQFLPQKFARRKSNTTYLNWSTDSLYWKIEWIFPQANNYRVCDKRVLDTDKVFEAVEKYTNPEKCQVEHKEALRPYHERQSSDTQLLLRGERQGGGSVFFLTERSATLRETLEGKVIIENPIFHVVLIDRIGDYQVLVSDDEDGSEEDIKSFFFN